jgi:hypothetical protein
MSIKTSQLGGVGGGNYGLFVQALIRGGFLLKRVQIFYF